MSADPTERMAGETGNLRMDEMQRIHRELRWARFVEGEPLLLEHLVEPVAPRETVPPP